MSARMSDYLYTHPYTHTGARTSLDVLYCCLEMPQLVRPPYGGIRPAAEKHVRIWRALHESVGSVYDPVYPSDFLTGHRQEYIV